MHTDACEQLCAASVAGDPETVSGILDQNEVLVGCHGSVREDHRSFMARENADNGWTPLHLATHYGQTDCVRILIERGADINAIAENPIANTPVHTCVVGGNMDCLRALLDHSPNLTRKDAAGSTPLDLARGNGATEMASLIEQALAEA